MQTQIGGDRNPGDRGPGPFPLSSENVRRVDGTANGFGRPYRVVVHGLPYFCQKLPGLVGSDQWDVRFHAQSNARGMTALAGDLRRSDLAYTWGGRISMGKFLWAARLLGKRTIVIFWCGSDVLGAQKELANGSEIDPWVADRIHWAASPTLAQEVRALGLRCEYVQASFVPRVEHPKPLPQKFSVLAFLPTAKRADLYGWDRIVQVALTMPSVEFKIVGLLDAQPLPAPSNVIVYGRIQDLTPFYEQCTVLWRPVRHDAGISFMVLEAMAHGRHVLYSYPLPGSVQVEDAVSARVQLERLLELHEAGELRLNQDGIDSVAENFSCDVVRSELRTRWEAIIRS